MGVAQNKTGGANRRFWSMLPLSRANHFCIVFFEPHMSPFCILSMRGAAEQKARNLSIMRPVRKSSPQASGVSVALAVEIKLANIVLVLFGLSALEIACCS